MFIVELKRFIISSRYQLWRWVLLSSTVNVGGPSVTTSKIYKERQNVVFLGCCKEYDQRPEKKGRDSCSPQEYIFTSYVQ
jgi:hypothetical protein